MFYAVPLFLASRADPDCVMVRMKQQWIALWHGWSIYVSLSVAVLQLLTSPAPYADHHWRPFVQLGVETPRYAQALLGS
ncbi:uncharacterized protein N7529_000677 [Penicillium soppii]|jgi:hypothetical protein|uniref:uncharacterized protein n=1 Tax=Penicillium soppii TaxID=69789 RepID=UPI0025476160|nr:uncharacterized protein N7529_000677 [Penicillium soppii]KAJ5882005.1 hypothetical protein N7529_000677 [Penicillium soppii]